LLKKDPDFLKQHFIPLDPELWNVSRYENFLEKRREIIAAAFKDILSLEEVLK